MAMCTTRSLPCACKMQRPAAVDAPSSWCVLRLHQGERAPASPDSDQAQRPLVCKLRMDVSQLFSSCIAGEYVQALRSLTDLLMPAQRVDLDRYQVTIGRKLGEGGAADVFLATTDTTAPGGAQQFALKRVRRGLALPAQLLPRTAVACRWRQLRRKPCACAPSPFQSARS